MEGKTEAKRLMKKIRKAEKRMEDARQRIGSLQRALSEVVVDMIPEGWEPMDGSQPDPVVGDWECETSPIGVCVYDMNGWNGYDECVFCGDPRERK